ncbi:MAG: molybdenum ABC transporter ATP-binding protein [Pseudohongiella sp.]|nr:molybdenum ABC transporter ATP-binding protein [Pseudohongiella sp.]
MIEANIELLKSDFRLRAEFSLPARGVTGIFGPSGCGKTSLLRALAGLEPETRGTIAVQGDDWLNSAVSPASLPVCQRRVGMVFQDASLFPHLNVEQNLLFGRNRLKQPSDVFDLEEFYALMGVQALLGRRTEKLSGGEKQRVALGRALLAEPVLLLMDEPLSALDQNTRNQLMSFLEKLFQQIEIPVFYVSHSSEEIARLADNLVLMEAGNVIEHGPIQAVLGRVDGNLASSDAAFSVLECRIKDYDLPHLTSVVCSGGEILQLPSTDKPAAVGKRVRLRIRARDVSLCLQRPQGSSILNILPAKISDIAKATKQGSRIIKLDINGDVLLAKVSEYSVQQLKLQPGQQLFAQIKSAALLS